MYKFAPLIDSELGRAKETCDRPKRGAFRLEQRERETEVTLY